MSGAAQLLREVERAGQLQEVLARLSPEERGDVV